MFFVFEVERLKDKILSSPRKKKKIVAPTLKDKSKDKTIGDMIKRWIKL